LATVEYSTAADEFFLPVPLQLFLGYCRQWMGTIRSVSTTHNSSHAE